MKGKIEKEFYVYRYKASDNTIIYVGKTDSFLKSRIDAHQKEDKFLPYLEDCQIEYILLNNRVETDIYEKYYINLWNPILNEKDKEIENFHLYIPDKKWFPYKKYLEKKEQERLKAYELDLKEALMNQNFFDCAYQAYLINKPIFITSFYHPTGLLPTPEGNVQVTTQVIEKINEGYLQKLNTNAINIFNMPNQIQVCIWEKVSTYKNIFLDKINILEDFLNKLISFRNQDYIEDEAFGFYFMYIEEHYKTDLVYSTFKDFFYEKGFLSTNSYVEINPEGYNSLIKIKEQIASLKLQKYKENDIIPYFDEDYNIFCEHF